MTESGSSLSLGTGGEWGRDGGSPREWIPQHPSLVLRALGSISPRGWEPAPPSAHLSCSGFLCILEPAACWEGVLWESPNSALPPLGCPPPLLPEC